MVCKGSNRAGFGFVTWAFSFVGAQVGAPTYTDLVQRNYVPLAREDPTRSCACCLTLAWVLNLRGRGPHKRPTALSLPLSHRTKNNPRDPSPISSHAKPRSVIVVHTHHSQCFCSVATLIVVVLHAKLICERTSMMHALTFLFSRAGT